MCSASGAALCLLTSYSVLELNRQSCAAVHVLRAVYYLTAESSSSVSIIVGLGYLSVSFMFGFDYCRSKAGGAEVFAPRQIPQQSFPIDVQ